MPSNYITNTIAERNDRVYFVLIDDIARHNEYLSQRLQSLCRELGIPCHIALTTTNPQDVLSYAKDCTQPTAYFMDIELGENQTSLSLFGAIQQNSCESYIVYVSAHAQYALECLHTHAFDFLLKPWTDEQLSQCLQAIWRTHLNRTEASSLQVNTGSRITIAPLDEILYFTRERMNIRMFMQDASSLVWRESFEHLMERLPAEQFVLCHRSYVVNLKKIKSLDWDTNQITMQDRTAVPISRRRAAALRAALKQGG